MIRNTPMTDEEIASLSNSAWEDGIYPFTVVGAIEGRSSKGNDMITLDLDIHKGGQTRAVKAWLVFMESMQWQVKAFYESIHGLHVYESGQVDANKLIGKKGQCSLTSEEGKDRDGALTGKFYNRIDTYEKPAAGQEKAPAKADPMADNLDDDSEIPF
jgi:hypothetical protein